MISYLLIFISLLVILFPKKISIDDENYIYLLLFTAFPISHLTLGFISLLFVHLNISNFPNHIYINLISFNFLNG